MRLKTYTAPTTAEAMKTVRQEMGENAIIVSSRRASGNHGARVTAALETDDDDAIFLAVADEDRPGIGETIRQRLLYHGTPKGLADRLVRAALALDADDPTMAFAGALDTGFAFAPLAEAGDAKPTMLVGPPGSGKTVTTAKLAARATLAGRGVEVVTTDTQRAGGIEQLAAFTRILGLDLKVPETVDDLRRVSADLARGVPTYIDTQGTNPFSDGEMDLLSDLIAAAGAEPVLVIAAGGDALEAAEIASAFAAIGATRLLVTRLDMARRMGSILTAGDAGHLKFCDVSISAHVADGLSAINPVSLARLIMPHATEYQETPYLTEAAS